MTKRDLFVALAAGAVAVLASSAVLAQQPVKAVTGTAAPKQKWDAFCADAVGAGVKTAAIVGQSSATDGWNAVLKKYGEGGWEPVQFIHGAAGIDAVCFKRAL